jgi:hypothetical protein
LRGPCAGTRQLSQAQGLWVAAFSQDELVAAG